MRIGVIGCGGRMGRANLRAILEARGVDLGGGIERPGHPVLGQDLGSLAGLEPVGLRATDDLAHLLARCDVVIEFSSPAATLANLALSAGSGTPHVIGTTGLDAEEEARLRGHAERIPVVWAANMSVGVNLLLDLVTRAAAALDPGFDIEIVEMHHRHKVDAPSGTALALGKAAAAGRGVELAAVAERGRDGMTGARVRGAIGFASLRGGDVVGDHRVVFAGAGERLEFAHLAAERSIYARGALQAARWVVGQGPGVYGMRDVLGLS